MGACRNVSQCQNVNKRTRTQTHTPRLAKSISTIQRQRERERESSLGLSPASNISLLFGLNTRPYCYLQSSLGICSAQLSAHTHTCPLATYVCVYVCVCVQARNAHVLVSHTYYLLYYKIIRAFSSFFGFIFAFLLFIFYKYFTIFGSY